MTDPMDPRARDPQQHAHRVSAPCEQDEPVPYRDGRVQIIYARDRESATLARLVKLQCDGSTIDAELTSVEDVRLGTLHQYTALALIMTPAAKSGDPSQTSKFDDIFSRYRRFRPNGLSAVLDSKSVWHEAGVVEILFIGAERDAQHPAFTVLDRACRTLFVSHADAKAFSPLGNIFDVYTPQPTVAYDPEQVTMDGVRRQWEYLQAWGVSSPKDVSRIKEIVQEMVEFFSNPKFSKMSRPVKNSKLNRLQWVIKAPEYRLAKEDQTDDTIHIGIVNNRKNFIADGATVCRKTVLKIKQEFPEIRRPAGRENTKDLSIAFRDFYVALNSVDSLASELHERLTETH